MQISRTILVSFLVLSLGISLCAFAQNDPAPAQKDGSVDSGASQNDAAGQRPAAPSPAFGQNAPILNPENPPVSGLDQPSLDMRTSSRSFISPALVVSESADTNSGNVLGKQDVREASEILGAFDLQKFWAKTDMFAEYVGGGVFYNGGRDSIRQVQALGFLGVTRWRTGQISVRDSFTYLPDGTFGIGAYGAIPGIGLARLGGSSGIPAGGLPGTLFFGSPGQGSVGLIPRLSNLVVADMVQSLSPRSAFTIAGAYSTSHYFQSGDALINSEQYTGEGGYSYMLGRRDQLGFVYGFQEFHFPLGTGGKVDANVINLRYGRTLSGRMSLILGAGPQHISIFFPGAGTNGRWSETVTAKLRYKFSSTSLTASYEKYTTAGSGFYAGANSQVARLGLMRPLGRTWVAYGDAGYSYHTRLQPFTGTGATGNHYSEGFVGAALRKQIGREFGVFAAYHFNDLAFDNGFCGGTPCSRVSNRHIGTVGFDWHPRPVRIE